MYKYEFTYVKEYRFSSIHASVNVFSCMFINMHLCLTISVYTGGYMNMYEYLFVYVYIYMYIYAFHICVCIHILLISIYINTNVHTYKLHFDFF
jgi:hypothetical protein